MTQTQKFRHGIHSQIIEYLKKKKTKISTTHPSDPKNLNNKEEPSEDLSRTLRRGSQIVMGGTGREGPVWEWGRERKVERRKMNGERVMNGGR